MVDPVQELKTRAEILHHRVASGDAAAMRRLRALAEFMRADEATVAAAAPQLRRAHYLAIVAREHGFTNWEHARRVLEGAPDETDFGTLLYGKGAGAVLTVWFVDYAEARNHLDETRARGERRYLLAWRRQFFIAEWGFITSLGMDPEDPDWSRIDFDWARPSDPEARRRLYQRLLDATRGCQ